MRMTKTLLASMMLAATAGMMTSCATEDNPSKPTGPSESVIKEKIVGKWKAVTQDGLELTTNGRTVLTFNTDGTRTVSKSYYDTNTESYIWRNKQTGTYAIEGNQLKSYLDEADLYDVVIYDIDAISDNKMSMTMENFRPGRKFEYKRITADYSADLIGLWEVTEMTGEDAYNDDNARLAFMPDGTYRYYRKNDAGEWQVVSTRDVEEYNIDTIAGGNEISDATVNRRSDGAPAGVQRPSATAGSGHRALDISVVDGDTLQLARNECQPSLDSTYSHDSTGHQRALFRARLYQFSRRTADSPALALHITILFYLLRNQGAASACGTA